MIRTAVRLLILPHRRLRLEWPCALAAAILLLHVNLGDQAAHGQCQYEIIGEIKGPDCGLFGVPQTRARGMNNHGHVVGDRDDCFDLDATHVFIWKQETGRVDLPTPANVFQAFGRDINDDGFIVGEHDILGPTGIRAFVWNPNTEEYTYLDPVFPDSGHSYVSSINSAGIAGGRRTITPQGVSPAITSAYLWNVHTGEVIDLGVPNGQHSGTEGGNENGESAGWSGGANQPTTTNNKAVVWLDGEATILELPRGTEGSFSMALNSRTEVIGQFKLPGLLLRGFLWRQQPAVELVPSPPFDRFAPRDIASTGQIVGYQSGAGVSSKVSLWQHGQFHQLQDLLVSEPPTPSFGQIDALISDSGLIVVRTSLPGTTLGAVLLKPVDVPTGDLDFDCEVGVPDLLILLKQFSTAGGIPSADFNGDGTVSVPDLILLLQNWGPQ